MINITSEGNLFTSFCISVAGTASFHQLEVTALFQFLLFSQFSFLLVNFHLFASFVVALCCLYNCVKSVCNSGIETHQVD